MRPVSFVRRRFPNIPPSPALLFYFAVGVPVIALLGLSAASETWRLDDLRLLFWVAAIAWAELLPVQAWGGAQLTISFPLLIAVVILFGPEKGALAAFVGTFDVREFRRDISFFKSLFNRSQIAATAYVAGVLFHALSSVDASWGRLLGTGLVVAAVAHGLNLLLISSAMALDRRASLREVIRHLPIGESGEFSFLYIGLGALGVPLARLYHDVRAEDWPEWTVVFFMIPLLLARQTFARSRALEEAGAELRERERLLMQLSNRMAEERYDERKQVAGYLHDDLAQVLFRLGLQADTARSQLERGEVEKAVAALEQVEEMKDSSIKLVRGLIRDLDRSPLGRAGLPSAIATLTSELSRSSRARFHVEVEDLPLPAPIQLLVYQIAREAVHNAVNHSDPSNVWVSVGHRDGDVQLLVRDDGAGFDAKAAAPDGHFGLALMRERALLTGGSFSIDSTAGVGTVVTLRFRPQWIEDGDGTRPEQSEAQPATPQSAS